VVRMMLVVMPAGRCGGGGGLACRTGRPVRWRRRGSPAGRAGRCG